MEKGRRIAHYELLEKLGEGGMGVVYKARDTKLDCTVALKFLPAHLRPDEEAKARFVQEAKAASALDHANICTIHDISETEAGELYIVMAYYQGQTLGYRLAAEDFPVDRCVDIGLQLARALERAHEAGIVHRDLKPANVLVTDRGEVKLLDFGIAKLASSRHDLTRTGSTVGTAGYMSPEQVDGGDVDARSDLFSLGAVLYELLTGRKAFQGETPVAAAVAVLHADPPPLAELRPQTPEPVRRIVEACLQKDRNERPAGATEVVAALEDAGRPAAGGARRAEATGRRRRWPLAAGTIAVAVGVAAVASLLLRPGSPAVALDPDRIAVIPFTVAGSPDLAYLGEGVVDLLSTKLDGAGSLAAVNPRGEVDEAVLYYSRLVELWRECEPDVAPRREAIQARLEALLEGRT